MDSQSNSIRRTPMQEVPFEQPFSPRAYSIAEVCRMTGLGRTSIYSAIKSGALVSRKWGRRTVVLECDLGEFLRKLPKSNAHDRREKK